MADGLADPSGTAPEPDVECGPWKPCFQGLGRVFVPIRSMEPMLGYSRIQARWLPEPGADPTSFH